LITMQEHQHGWKRLRSDAGPDLKLFRARFDHMQNPRNGCTERMIILEADDSVNVIALTPSEEILFVKQYRFGIGFETFELPGGIVDPEEDFLEAARRELREETGHTGSGWASLGRIPSNPVFMESWIHHWLVRDVAPTHAQELDEGETVEVVTFPLPEVWQKLKEGFFQHPHTVSALVCFFARWPVTGKTGNEPPQQSTA